METLDAYLERLASDAAIPGGGSAAALVGALGAALIAMVARITLAIRRTQRCERACERVVAASRRAARGLTAARERDEAAFAEVVAAQALPRATDTEKAARRQALETRSSGPRKRRWTRPR